MKTTPLDRRILREHAVKGSTMPRTTATFTAKGILDLLDDVDYLLKQRIDGKTIAEWEGQQVQ